MNQVSETAARYGRMADLRKKLQLPITLAIITLTFLILLLWDRMFWTVRTGEAGVLFDRFRGTEMTTIRGEGLHVILPWNVLTIYNVKLQTVERDFHLLTKTGLPVDLKVAIRYRADIRTLPSLHTTVGEDYLDKVVIPETEAVLRRSVGQYDPEEIYTSERGLLESIVVAALTESEDRFVLIDDVLIKSVSLPQPIQEAIESKQIYQQREKAYKFRLAIEHQEAERKRIEATGVRDAQKIVRESIDTQTLRWQGIQATRDLATSSNAKTVIIGSGPDGLPLILGNDRP